ncbi:LPS-assembly protein LptD [bacterium BMS3Abin04]|nr:LPS-assembly protein LptD [bacterium BMS3Abin04]
MRITCNKAIQHLSKNEVELIGNVIVTQDSIVVKSAKGYYFGDSEKTYSDTTIHLTNGNMDLLADRGYYYIPAKKAFFFGNVLLTEDTTRVYSDSLTYFEKEEKAVAVGNVKVQDSTTIIYADSLIHFRDNKNTFAFGNVKLVSTENNIQLFGARLEDYGKLKDTKIFGSPALIQIDTAKDGKVDTLMILSKMMEAHKDSSKALFASDSVKILRGDFSSLNNHTNYFKKDEHIKIYKTSEEDKQPILWADNSQVTGDSIDIYLKDSQIKLINIFHNCLIVSTMPKYKFRYNQISGDTIKLFFDDSKLQRTEVAGNVLSIYYMFEDDEPNGLLKSSAERAKIYFNKNKVENVKLYGSPASEYHPEGLVKGKEKSFTLPNFILYKNRPSRNYFLKYFKM